MQHLIGPSEWKNLEFCSLRAASRCKKRWAWLKQVLCNSILISRHKLSPESKFLLKWWRREGGVQKTVHAETETKPIKQNEVFFFCSVFRLDQSWGSSVCAFREASLWCQGVLIMSDLYYTRPAWRMTMKNEMHDLEPIPMTTLFGLKVGWESWAVAHTRSGVQWWWSRHAGVHSKQLIVKERGLRWLWTWRARLSVPERLQVWMFHVTS